MKVGGIIAKASDILKIFKRMTNSHLPVKIERQFW